MEDTTQIDTLLQDPLNKGQQIKFPLDATSKNILRQFFESLTPQAFPIGTIYTSVISTNPATTLGYGTWSAFATGRTLVGVDTGQTEFDTVEETGGAKTHTLTTAEIPAHSHDIYVGNTGSGSPSVSASGTNTLSSSGYITNTGGGGSHNNLQPYITVYFWKRTA